MNELVLSTADFTYTAARRCFVAEASDLKLKGIPGSFALRSHRTGGVLRFVRDSSLINSRENEVLAYVYAVAEDYRNDRMPSDLYDLQVVVYND